MDTPAHRPGTPAWVDVTVDALEAHGTWRAFLTALFGWSWDQEGDAPSHYAVARHDGRAVLGLTVDPAAPVALTTYFATGDAEASLTAALALGATATTSVLAVGGLGRMALLRDPTGAPVGLWEAGTFADFGATGEPGAPGWFDHHSDDPATAAAFYASLLGHGVVDTGDPAMSVIADGERWLASFSPSRGPEQGPPAWNPIYLVDSLERAREAALRAGGSVLLEEMDVPGGSICVVGEPTRRAPLTLLCARGPA